MEVDNLSEQEKMKLAACVNPDADSGAKFQFGPEIEQMILAAMLRERAFLTQSKTLISPKYFANAARELICDTLVKYFDDYHAMPPKAIMKVELEKAAKGRNKNPVLYDGELMAVYANYEPELQAREYLLDQIEEFAKVQSLKLAYNKTVDIVFSSDADKWSRIWDILKQPFQISRNKDYGLDYFHTIEEWFARQKEKKENMEVFTSGFDTIDYSLGDGGGVAGELYGWMGMPGTGKSLLLVKTALANVKRGKKCLFLSLEMDADKVAKRFHSQLTKVNIHEIMAHEKMVVDQVKWSLEDLHEKFHAKVPDDRYLIIKQFPAGTLDLNGLRSFMTQLTNESFKPDLLIVDYVGELKDFAGMETHESRQRLCRDLRAMGVELQHNTWTALQPNRGGRQAQKGMGVLDDDNIGDSYGQIRVFDGLWSINQSREEKQMNLARIFNIKLRDGKSNISFPVFVDPQTLDIDQIGDEEYKEKMSHFKEVKMGQVAIDGKVWKPNPVMEHQIM